MKKKDALEPGIKMLDSMMKDAMRPSSNVTYEDKLKLLDRWVKVQELIRRQRQGGMGTGFDEPGEENDGADL
jgi:hypothetical protein